MGRYLGPAIDVGSAMTYKILEENFEYVCRTTFRSLKPNELAFSEHKQLRDDFNTSVADSLGPAITVYDFDHQ